MVERDDEQFRRRYGGHYVATRDGKVVASADTYDRLSDDLDRTASDWSELIIEYVEPFDVARIY